MNNKLNQDSSKEIQIIESIINLDFTPISIYKNDKLLSEGQIFKKGGKNCISTPKRFKEEEDVQLKTQFEKTIFTTLHTYQTSAQIKDKKGSFCCTYLFKELWTEKISKEDISLYKCFIPINTARLNTFHSELETIKSDFNRVQINVDKLKFDIEQIKKDEIGFYAITAHDSMSFELFEDYCFAIRQALGFIMGCMPGGNLYYFNEELNFYYTNATRPTLRSFYYPIHTNPYHLIQFKSTPAENYKGKLNILPIANFSQLVFKIKENDLLSSLIIMMLEGESIQSLLVKPSIYSVALEGLSKIITTPPSETKKPIKDGELFSKIVSEMNEIIDSYNGIYDPQDNLTKLKRRVNELNKPINLSHLSNNEKLIQPFDLLGLKLSDEDIEVIEHRNDLLHGNIHLESDKRGTTTDINDYLLYTSAKLYTLVSSLILKFVGYNGYIINHSKPFEKYCGILSKDDYYKKI